VLETRRLRLEELSPSHGKGMFKLWSDAAVCEHSGTAVDSADDPIVLPATSRVDSDRLLDYWLDRARARSGFRWAVILRDSGDFIGAVGFNSVDRDAEFAYHIISRYWEHGFAAEASRSALAWSFAGYAESVRCYIEPANTRSIKLAERLDFQLCDTPDANLRCYILARDHHSA
jgi:RimJ/RimL family protein N-acetyltransferase